MKKVITEITAFLLCLILLLGVCWRMAFVMMPKRTDYGGTWNMYLEEPKDSIDVMIVGSSHAYCNIIPAGIYQKTGYTAYALTAPCLTMPLAYYYIKEGLKTQSPSHIMLEATGFFFNRYMGHAKASMGYMPWGLNRLGAILTSAEPDEKAGLLFPMFNYHDRWDEFELSDFFKKREDQIPDLNAGYTYLDVSEPQTRAERVFEYTDADIKLQQKDLKKIIDLCKKEGINLEVIITPAASYVTKADQKYITDVLGDTPFYDFNDDFDSLGLDLQKDFYDARHLNVYGAVKFTKILADYIAQNYTVEKRINVDAVWLSRVEKFNSYK